MELTAHDPYEQTLRPVKVNDTWGYFRVGDGLVIDAVFESVKEFSEGCAAVCLEARDQLNNRQPLYAIINESGEMLIPPVRGVPVSPHGFTDGRLLVLCDTGSTFLLDKSGHRHFEGQFAYLDSFYDGRACVRVGERYGFIDVNGEIVIAPRFGKPAQFSDGFALVSEPGGRTTGIIDTQGNDILFPGQDLRLTGLSEGVVVARSLQGEFFMNLNGEPLFDDLIFPYGVLPYSEGMACFVATPGDAINVGFIDRDGRQYDPQYVFAEPFEDDLCQVQFLDGRKAFINKKCEHAIDVSDYTRVGNFMAGLAPVWQGQKLGYINKHGGTVWEPTM